MADEQTTDNTETVPVINTVKVYPTTPDAEGWYYQDANYEEMGIETRKDDKGRDTLRATLPDSKKVVVVRMLTGRDTVKAERTAGKDSSMIDAAVAAQSTTFDGKPMLAEDIINLYNVDYKSIRLINQLLGNF